MKAITNLFYLGHGADIRHVPGLTCFAERTHWILCTTGTDVLPLETGTEIKRTKLQLRRNIIWIININMDMAGGKINQLSDRK